MSKVPYTIDVNRYICTELEYLRKMLVTHDFSMMPAVIERIQFHASSMEEALYRYEGIKYTLKNAVDDEKMTDEEFRKKALKVLENIKSNEE